MWVMLDICIGCVTRTARVTKAGTNASEKVWTLLSLCHCMSTTRADVKRKQRTDAISLGFLRTSGKHVCITSAQSVVDRWKYYAGGGNKMLHYFLHQWGSAHENINREVHHCYFCKDRGTLAPSRNSGSQWGQGIRKSPEHLESPSEIFHVLGLHQTGISEYQYKYSTFLELSATEWHCVPLVPLCSLNAIRWDTREKQVQRSKNRTGCCQATAKLSNTEMRKLGRYSWSFILNS